ncbi:MAG: Asd/ArgC dimerization domain-containing protein, partial [Candidatus Omnitrophica bacterium]|nr:Asd/ArgC dimerization domain-containing protein [Candidatus Omnitrophota bacterium]
TSIIFGLIPLVKEKLVENKIIINSCSAITGAGRKAILDYHYSNVADNIWAYKPFAHQHIPEVIETLKTKTGCTIKPYFTPHVAGVEAGIYSTIFVTFKKNAAEEDVRGVFNAAYKNCPFVRLLANALPKLKDTAGTNFCDIGIALDSEGENALICSSIDNLIKGAAGQAVQNLNIMLGLNETTGLL